MATTLIAACCSQCRQGVPFGTAYSYCIECNIDFCATCVSNHSSFAHKIHRIKPIPTLPYEPYFPRECQVCNNLRHGIFTCDDIDDPECDLVVCFACLHQMGKAGKYHEHIDLKMRDLPHRNCLPSSGRECTACESGQAYSHCSRCRAGIRDGQLIYECKDCMRVYGQCTISLCVACFKEVGHQVADTNHHWASFRIRMDSDKEKGLCALHCLDCDRYYPSWNQQVYANHAHSKWELVLGSMEAESWRKENFHSCPVRPRKKPTASAASGSEMTCGWCGLGSRTQRTYFCGTCVVEFCGHCKYAGLINHSHPLVTLKTTTRAAPTDYWKVIVAEKEFGRNCDSCGEGFADRVESYMCCNKCQNYDFCLECIGQGKADFSSHECGGVKQDLWDFFETEGADDQYFKDQDALAERERKRRKDEETRRRASLSPVATANRSVSPVQDIPRRSPPSSSPATNNVFGLPFRSSARAGGPLLSQAPTYGQQRQSSGRGSRALEAIASGVTSGAINSFGGSNSFGSGGFGGLYGTSPWAMQAQNMQFMAAAQQNMWNNAFAPGSGMGFDPTGGLMGAGLGGMGMDPTGGMMGGMMGMGMFGGFGL